MFLKGKDLAYFISVRFHKQLFFTSDKMQYCVQKAYLKYYDKINNSVTHDQTLSTLE